MKKKPRLICKGLRLSDEEAAALTRLAAIEELPESYVLRRLVKREVARIEEPKGMKPR